MNAVAQQTLSCMKADMLYEGCFELLQSISSPIPSFLFNTDYLVSIQNSYWYHMLLVLFSFVVLHTL